MNMVFSKLVPEEHYSARVFKDQTIYEIYVSTVMHVKNYTWLGKI